MKYLFCLLLLSFFIAPLAHASSIIKPGNNLGLVGYWSFNEGTSTIAHDFSGNGRNGTLSSTGSTLPAWTSGKLSKGLSFDGSTNYVTLPNSVYASLAGGTAVTISLWFKGSQSTSAVRLQTDSANYIVFPYHFNGSPRSIISTDGTTNGLNVVANIEDGKWHHIVFTWQKNTVNGWNNYVDGVLDGSKNAGNVNLPPPAGGNVYLGTYNAGQELTNGSIDEVRVYNRALSASEVAGLYKVGAAKLLQPNNRGLVGYWSFNEGTGTIAHDFSGNGYNGTLLGTQWVAGRVGNAISTSTAGVFATFPLIWTPTSFSVAWWVDPANCVSFNQDVKAASGWGAFFFHTTSSCEAYTGTDISTRFTNSDLPAGTVKLNQWQYFTYTYDGTQGRFYKNGALLVGPRTQTTPVAWQGFQLGDAGSPTTNGKYDELRIYNRALSAQEVANLYNASSAAHANTSSALLQNGTTLTSGLVGYWTFDGSTITDKIYDSSGQARNGYIFNEASTSAKTIGKLGQALSFDSSVKSEAQLAGASLGATSVTVSAWVKVKSFSESTFSATGGTNLGAVIFNTRGNGTDISPTLLITPSGSTPEEAAFVCDSNNLAVGVKGATTIKTNQWYSIVGTFSYTGTGTFGGTWDVYVNGVKDDPAANSVSLIGTCSGSFTGTTWRVANSAAWPSPDTETSNIVVDDLRVYNRALSASEVQQLYNMGK